MLAYPMKITATRFDDPSEVHQIEADVDGMLAVGNGLLKPNTH